MQPGFLTHLKELPPYSSSGAAAGRLVVTVAGVDRSGLLTQEKLKVTPAFVKEADKTRNAYGAELSAG